MLGTFYLPPPKAKPWPESKGRLLCRPGSEETPTRSHQSSSRNGMPSLTALSLFFCLLRQECLQGYLALAPERARFPRGCAFLWWVVGMEIGLFSVPPTITAPSRLRAHWGLLLRATVT